MIIVIADVDEVAALLGLSTERHPTIIRPQESGPCVHCEDGTPYRCTYPYDDGRCPHLDNPEILCPVKDACEAEQEEQDADMAAQDAVYETETPEFVEPTPEEEPVYEAPPLAEGEHLDPRRWTPEEEGALRGATTPAEAIHLYRAAYPGSSRTDAAIKSRYNLKIRPQRGATPAPDFAGDTVPVTQWEGAPNLHRSPAISRRVRILDPVDLAGRKGAVLSVRDGQMLVALDGSPDRVWVAEENCALLAEVPQ